MSFRRGFTLIEVLIYATIFSVASTVFLGVFFSVSNIQNRETAGVEVGRQLDFLLQNLQRYIRESSAIEMDSGVIASTVKLRTKETSKDPTLIYLANDLVYLQEGNGAPFLLTNNKVKVQKLEFEKIVNESGHDSLRVNVLLAYNTDNPKLQITRSAQIVIPRISTVVFDSNLLPNSNKTYSLGSINSKLRDLTLAEDFLIGVNGGSLIMGTGTLIEPTDYLLIFTSGVNAL